MLRRRRASVVLPDEEGPERPKSVVGLDIVLPVVKQVTERIYWEFPGR